MQYIRQIFSFRVSNPILAGLCYAFAWMMIGAFILSLVLWLSGLQEQELTKYTYIIHALSCIMGGIVSGKRSSHKGWMRGALTGLCYGIIILLVGFLALDGSSTFINATWIVASIISGAIGGVLGINLKNNR
ncbi:TIGR04086 family membrane protein [Paenibacillus sp. CMAA1364]